MLLPSQIVLVLMLILANTRECVCKPKKGTSNNNIQRVTVCWPSRFPEAHSGITCYGSHSVPSQELSLKLHINAAFPFIRVSCLLPRAEKTPESCWIILDSTNMSKWTPHSTLKFNVRHTESPSALISTPDTNTRHLSPKSSSLMVWQQHLFQKDVWSIHWCQR